MVHDVVRSSSSVVEAGVLFSDYVALGKWHRSKDRRGGDHPFASFMLNKKWTLEEEFNNHS